MWILCLTLLAVVLVWRTRAGGPSHGLGCAVVASLLAPTWVVLELGDFSLDLRVAGGILALSLYCVHPRAEYRAWLGPIDWIGLAVATTFGLADLMNDPFVWATPLRIYGEWVVPYLAGRQAIQSWHDARRLTPWVVVVCLVMSSEAIVEMLGSGNLFEQLFGVGRIEGMARGLSRWGWIRAIGPVTNPIFFGVLLLLLFPWTLHAAARAGDRSGPAWWRSSPGAVLAGIVCCLSRAPLLAIVPLLHVAGMLASTRWRKLLIVGAVAGAVLLAVGHQRVLNLLVWIESAAGAQNQATITVGGRKVIYTGTMHRLYLFEVYGTAMQRAGWLGFGTDRTSVFPPRVPIGPEHAETLHRVSSIDNAYILIVLRYGFLGLATFLALGAAGAATYATLAVRATGDERVFAAAMSGTLIATMLTMLTVWMPHDFGFWYVWTIGTAAGLRTSAKGSRGARGDDVDDAGDGPGRGRAGKKKAPGKFEVPGGLRTLDYSGSDWSRR